jgi:hypothetical protein
MDYIYRIQDKDGRGPWKPGFSRYWCEDKSDEVHAKLKPWPLEFGLGILDAVNNYEHVACGCTSPEQLRTWFSEIEYGRLLKYGYMAFQIVPWRILAQSDIQCVFTTRRPLRKESLLIDLYPTNGD